MDADAHKSLGQTYGVSGFPTIKLFNGKKHTPFQGQRTAEKFVDAALQLAKEKAYEALGKKAKSSSDKVWVKSKLKCLNQQSNHNKYFNIF